MRKLFPLILIGLLASCTHSKELSPSIQKRVDQFNDFKQFEVPIRSGFATIVTYGADTLAVATEPMSILIPKSEGIQTKSESTASVKIDYATLESVKATFSQYWQAVMFEDSEKGDYDYNDLIIHVKNQNEKGVQKIYIQPVALGSGKTIGLGCILPDHQERIISTDVRADLFDGREGYINTSNDPTQRYILKHYASIPLNGKTASIAWFIEVDGQRFYAVSTELDYKNYGMFNKEGMPYGLVRNSTFNYPQECRSIFKTYPDFQAWINGERSDIGLNDPALTYKWSSLKYPFNDGGVKASVWDY